MSSATDAGVHPSHQVREDYGAPDPHNPAWFCEGCRESACSMCPLDDDDPLRAPCTGFPWHQGTEVTGPDGITRTVRKSGTGWPPTR